MSMVQFSKSNQLRNIPDKAVYSLQSAHAEQEPAAERSLLCTTNQIWRTERRPDIGPDAGA